jgi:CDP-diglyceride synthetase
MSPLKIIIGPLANLHNLGSGIRHFYDRPYMAIALIILALGTLECLYAFSPKYSRRHRYFQVFFWILYPFLLLVFMTGRKMRKDEDTHKLYAIVIVALGLLAFVTAAFF